MAQGTFWRGRIASEALGVLLVLAGVLAALSLLSYDPRDPSLFSITAGGEAASPTNWIGGFGASLSSALYALVGFAAWGVPVLLLLWGWRMFWQRPVENPATKAAGIGLLFLSIPALLSLGLGRRPLFGEEAESGGVIGRAIAETARGRLGTTGAALLAAALLLIAVPLSTQVSLAEVFAGLRVRFAGFLGRMTVGWARRRDRRMKERLRRAVVAKHIEKARREPVTLGEVPFVSDEGSPVLREVPGEGRFSIRRTTAPLPAAAAPPAAVRARKREPQPSLPLAGLDGYPYPDVGLLDRRDAMGIVDRKALAETGKSIAAKCAEFGVEGEIVEYHPGPVVTTYEFRPAAGIKVNQVMSLSEDLALALSAESIRIERLPGRASVGIEVPNPGGGEIISLRDVIESDRFRRSPSLLTLALGKDIHGEPVVDDLRGMPHLLIAALYCSTLRTWPTSDSVWKRSSMRLTAHFRALAAFFGSVMIGVARCGRCS